MKLIYSILAGLLILVSVTTSCQKEYVVVEVVDIPDTISFAEHVVPIFTESCNMSGCHITGGVPPDLTADNAHFDLTITGLVNIDDPEASVLYQRIKATVKPMPPSGPMQVAKQQIILNWIAQGALDN